jgi:hypothetical protein
MKWLKSLLQNKKQSNVEEKVFITRQGKTIEADDTYLVRMSGNFKQMLKATELESNQIDRHFLLQTIIDESYKKRTEPQYKEYCLKYSEIHLSEFDRIAPVLKGEFDSLPRVTVFQHYATLLTELGQFEKAIEVCEMAISYGLSDGTKGGYEVRIERIRKKNIK